MGDIYLSSDTHFFHKKILQFCPDSRPFETVEEMNEAIVERFNSRIKPGDSLYLLGDLSWGKPEATAALLKRINGQKFSIKGNHDHILKHKAFNDVFVWKGDYKTFKYKDKFFVLSHFPFRHWDRQHYGSIHCYGHLHSNEKGVNTMDVGVDSNNLFPYHVDEVIDLVYRDVTKDERPGRSVVR